MRVLMISGDSDVLDPNSAAGKRTEEYRRILGELEVLLCFGSIKSFIAGFWKGRAMLERKAFDAITAQSPEHWLLAWLFSRMFRVPWQAQVHTDIFSPYFYRESLKNKLRVWLAKFLLPKADVIRVVSERIKNSIMVNCKLKIENSAIVVLPIFVDVRKIQSAKIKIDLRQKYSDYDFRILMASRLTREKNIGLAVEAMQAVVKKHPRTLLVIVGEGPELKNLQLSIINYQLQNNVRFEPWTEDLFSYYKTADLFLLTSDYEGYGRTVIEAMAAGLPVIMTDVGLAGELLIDDLDGRVTPVGDLEKLQQAIIDLLENPEKRKALAEESRKVSASLPSKEDYWRLYKEAMALMLK
jgi:glycosyltransferase involved in cell wall biosynthesis